MASRYSYIRDIAVPTSNYADLEVCGKRECNKRGSTVQHQQSH